MHAILEKVKESEDETAEGETSLLDQHPVLKQFDFSATDRAHPTPSKYVDSVISGTNGAPALSLADAHALLDLLLASADESEGVVFAATGTGQPERLGLPADVIQAIPLDGRGFTSDAQGWMPITLLGAILFIIVAPFILLGLGFGVVLSFLVMLGIALVGIIGPLFLAAIEAALKALVLVFFYIVFAILVLTFTILILMTGVVLGLVALATGAEFTLTINHINYWSDSFSLEMTEEISNHHSLLLDLDTLKFTFVLKMQGALLFSVTWMADLPFLILGQETGQSDLLSSSSELCGGMVDSKLTETTNYAGSIGSPNMAGNSNSEYSPVIPLPWGATAVGPLDDEDDDGIPDKYEIIAQYTDTDVDDFDGDGLPNEDEARYHTCPYLPDSDFDGLSDGWEVDVMENGWQDAGILIIEPGKISPDKPDLFVEIDWASACKPWTGQDLFTAVLPLKLALFTLGGILLIAMIAVCRTGGWGIVLGA